MSDSITVDKHPAYKLFISDLSQCQLNDNLWSIKFGNNLPPKQLVTFQIQAQVLKISAGDVMIVSDNTGTAKITRGNRVPGNFSYPEVGATYSIIGSLKAVGKLPQIDVIKMVKIENSIQKELWQIEVKELKNFLSKAIKPRLEGVSC